MKIVFKTVSILLALLVPIWAVEKMVLWPSATPPVFQPNSKAFTAEVVGNEIKLSLNDIENSDDYIHLNFGKRDLKDYIDGGYIEVVMSADSVNLQSMACVADPKDFWPTRLSVEGEAIVFSNTFVYRHYLDTVTSKRVKEGKDNLYLFFHDLGGKSWGSAQVQIKSVTICPPTKNWREEKIATYKIQFRHPPIDLIEPLYYEDFSRGERWDSVASHPGLSTLDLSGVWKKKFFGEHLWDTNFLGDFSQSLQTVSETDYESVSVPEAEVSNQAGGFFWYRKSFDLPSDFSAGKVWLRLDDLCDEARLFINGQSVGTMTPVEKRIDWVVENGSRTSFMKGISAKRAITWKNFDRTGNPFQFDSNAIPENANRLILPITSGQYEWPLAYDVTSLVKPGKNILAVRLYGNPTKGWWIFRSRSDRAFKNIYGILGGVRLAWIGRALISSFERVPPSTATENGTAVHPFIVKVNDPGKLVKSVHFTVDGKSQNVPLAHGEATSSFSLPASFERHSASVMLLGENGMALDQREINFHGAVVSWNAEGLRVNGDRYFVRGINGMQGVEWTNNRARTQRERLRQLRNYEQLGINTVRNEGNELGDLSDAFLQGMMVLPVTAPASTDRGIQIFGQFEKPDHQLATERQRLLSLLLSEAPNVLMWNGGNEIHHTPGYDDRSILQTHLTEVRKAFRQFDPYKRPVTFANLDAWVQNWFFTEGQDVLGWNSYKPASKLAEDYAELKEATRQPLIFTEWGIEPGVKARLGRIDQWEAEMREKWNFITNTSKSVGAFIFPFHGELEDQRGIEFLQELFLPYAVEKKGESFVFKNTSESTMRKLRLQFVTGGSVVNGDYLQELKSGESVELMMASPLLVKGTRLLEIRYESHRGLNHFYSKEI